MTDPFDVLEHELTAAVCQQAGRRPRPWRRTATLALTATLLFAGGTLAAAGVFTSSERQSAALTSHHALPTIDPGDTNLSDRFGGAELRTIAQRIERSVPLPPGGSFDDIRWSGTQSLAGIRTTVEYTASCHWYRTLTSTTGAKHAQALHVVATIPRWPSFRRSVSGPFAQAIADAAKTGDLAPARRQLAINC